MTVALQPTMYTRRALVGTAILSACLTLALVSNTRTLESINSLTRLDGQSMGSFFMKDISVNMMLNTGQYHNRSSSEPLGQSQEEERAEDSAPQTPEASEDEQLTPSPQDGQQEEEEGEGQEQDRPPPPAQEPAVAEEEHPEVVVENAAVEAADAAPETETRQQQQQQQHEEADQVPSPDEPVSNTDSAAMDDQEQQQQQQEEEEEEAPAVVYAAAPTPKPAHILVPVKGLKAPRLQCPNGRIVGPRVAWWKEWTDEHPLWKPIHRYPDPAHTYYLTFEPDMAGFNNVRMSVECAVAFAVITGRTLVLPDGWSIDHFRSQGNRGVADFYDLDTARHHLPMITMTEFLEKEAVTGGLAKPPPDNRTVWTPELGETFDEVWQYIREVAYVLPDGPNEHVMAFEEEEDRTRLDEMKNGREVVTYDDNLQTQKLVHMTTYADNGVRWLAHFYGYFFFGDVSRDNWVKRFMRDQFHFKADIVCPAGRVVDELYQEAGPGGRWTAMHIRRGDFESSYKPTWLPAEELFANIEGLIEPGSIVYISTNEKDIDTYFQPVAHRYRLRFLSNYTESAQLQDVDSTLHGMIEQVICGAATRFVGTYWSTFTNYINRLRGYGGREAGYYFVQGMQDELIRVREHYAKQPFFYREWEDVYDDIDMGWADDGRYAGEVEGWEQQAARRSRRTLWMKSWKFW